MSRIREALGLGPKQENRAPLVDDTRDVTDGETLASEINALENEVASDVAQMDTAERASLQLATFEMSRGTASLIDRALDSLSKNTGAGLEDPDAVAEAKARAAVIRASGNSLSTAISAYVAVTPVTEVAGTVYSLLYAVLRNALFFANLDYRQAEGMDMESEDASVSEWFYRYVGDNYVSEALGHVVDDKELSPDARENETEPPVGFGTLREYQLDRLQAIYGHGSSGDRKHLVGADSEDAANAVVTALSDMQMFFQLMVESFGWEADRPMPYGNVRNPDGTFTPITDPVTALDATEIKRVASQQRRKETRIARASAAATAAAALVAKALERRPIQKR